MATKMIKLNLGFKIALLWIVLINCLMFFFVHRTEVSDNWQVYPSVTAKPWAISQENNILKYFGYWDGPWYLSIAKEGYFIKAGQESNVVFAPLYPLTIKIAHTITQLPWHLAAALVSVLCTLFAVSLLYREIKMQWDEDIALRSIFFLLIFPSSFFLTVAYTEGLFLLLAVLFFYFLRQKKWWTTAVFVALAAVTKIWGIALLLIAVIEYIRQEKKIKISALAFLLPLLTIALWSYYDYRQFGDWLAFAHGQQFFHRPVGNFSWSQLWSAPTAGDKTIMLIDSLSALAALTAGLIMIYWKKIAYGLYAILGVAIPLASGTWQSMNRYVLVLFPLFIVLSILAKKNIYLYYFYLLVMPALLAMHLIQFVHFAWAG